MKLLKTINPSLWEQIHPTKNTHVNLQTITASSEQKLWWIGACGHQWETTVIARNKRKTGCPYCEGRQPLPGFNDLQTTHPDIAKEWHPTLNGDLTPGQVLPGSKQKIWWQDTHAHQWENRIVERTKRNYGCPYCSNRQVLTGFNDLQTTHPDIAAQWHPTLNNEKPTQVVAGSHRKAWWVGVCGHEWETTIIDRVKGKNCPYCSNKEVLTGFNDLQTTHPDIATQWHPTLNNEKPTQVVAGSHRKAWWVGVCGHEWEATINKRTRNNTGCPICAGKKVIPGFNDLASAHPGIAKEWHAELNGHSPEMVNKSSDTQYWWVCSYGHQWKTSVYNRTVLKTGCNICNNKNVLPGFNDLSTTHPDIAAEWDVKSNSILPSQVTAGSDLKVNWLCDAKQHSWEAYVYARTNSKTGTSCPFCAKGVSKAEEQVSEYLRNLGVIIANSARNIIPPYELDIYCPKEKIAIEFNGLYWHSEQFRLQSYHYNKWLACKEQGIQLIQIWEDDWNRKPELVKQMLTHKLGVSTQPKIYARNTIVKPITQTVANLFLNENHIQGAVDGGIRLGLFEKNTEKLVAVILLKKEPKTNGETLNLLRYATSTPTVGGFTKLIKHIERTYNPKEILTFSDNTISDGSLYRNHGFIETKQLKPDYMYVVQGERKHKFGYRLKRFQTDENLKYEETLTEKELAALNGLYRVWDAGKTRWVKENPTYTPPST